VGYSGSTAPGPRQTRLPFTASVLRRRPAATPYLGIMTWFSAPHKVHALPLSSRSRTARLSYFLFSHSPARISATLSASASSAAIARRQAGKWHTGLARSIPGQVRGSPPFLLDFFTDLCKNDHYDTETSRTCPAIAFTKAIAGCAERQNLCIT